MQPTAPEKKSYPNLERAREARKIQLSLAHKNVSPPVEAHPPLEVQRNEKEELLLNEVYEIRGELDRLRKLLEIKELHPIRQDPESPDDPMSESEEEPEPPKKKRKHEVTNPPEEEPSNNEPSLGLVNRISAIGSSAVQATSGLLTASALPILIIMYKAWRDMVKDSRSNGEVNNRESGSDNNHNVDDSTGTTGYNQDYPTSNAPVNRRSILPER